jgi:hypothetical protein
VPVKGGGGEPTGNVNRKSKAVVMTVTTNGATKYSPRPERGLKLGWRETGP